MEGPTVLKTVTKVVGRSPKATKQVHHALTIPEIVESIFSYSERGPLTKAGRVCREWHVISLPEIWRVLTSLVSLMELFCPMTFDIENGWNFNPDSSKADWDKFYSRASLVQTFIHDEKTKKGDWSSLISSQALLQLSFYASMAGHAFLLPKIRSVSWTARSEQTVLQLLPFISPELNELRLSLQNPTMHINAPRLLTLLGDRLRGGLQLLRLKTSYSSDERTEAALGPCLEKLPGLTNISLTAFYVSPRLVHHLRFTNSLRSFRATLAFGDPIVIRDFLTSLATSCPHITSIFIAIGTEGDRIPSTILEPLQACKGLLDLDFSYRLAMHLTPNEIRVMGRAWPKMRRLSICSCATKEVDGVGTPLLSLTNFASAFPALEELAHHFSFNEELPSMDAVWTRFNCLKVLGMGASAIPEFKVHAVAEFILGTCPEGVELVCDLPSHQVNFDTVEWPSNTEGKPFKDVRAILNIARRARIQWERGPVTAIAPS